MGPSNGVWLLSPHSAKIKNIISTEDAKARLLAEQQNKKKDSETSFVPTNMAVNYVQHNRCKRLSSLGRQPCQRRGVEVPGFPESA